VKPESGVQVSLRVRSETLAIARLGPADPWPDWALREGFVALVRTEAELSVVCSDPAIPAHVRAERGWRAFQVLGPLDFSMTGILSGLTSALAARGIAVFVVSTFDTDVILVRQERLAEAEAALIDAGYFVLPAK
jgi:hypothetical protein